jgi:hypothetical protein
VAVGVAAAGDTHVGDDGGVGALAAALGPGHPKLRCFALGSLMGMWCCWGYGGCDVAPPVYYH